MTVVLEGSVLWGGGAVENKIVTVGQGEESGSGWDLAPGRIPEHEESRLLISRQITYSIHMKQQFNNG